jgi:hypothetical protein
MGQCKRVSVCLRVVKHFCLYSCVSCVWFMCLCKRVSFYLCVVKKFVSTRVSVLSETREV